MLPEFLELRICPVLRRSENFAPTGGRGILSAPTITAYGPASLNQFPGGAGWSSSRWVSLSLVEECSLGVGTLPVHKPGRHTAPVGIPSGGEARPVADHLIR